MTEQTDTSAIRNKLFWADGRPSQAAGDAITALCDALDAARADRDAHSPASWNQLYARAEAAEANSDLADQRFYAANARIASALDIINAPWNGYRDDDAVRADLRRALTGEAS